MWCSATFNFRSSTVFDYVYDMSQVVECTLYLCADDSCLLFHHMSPKKKKKKKLTKDFSNICDWFVENKLSTYFGEDKTKPFYLVPNVI